MDNQWYLAIIAEKERFYRLAYSYVKNEQDALDIMQESMYKALKQYGRLREKDVVITWFYRIVINTSLNFLKKNAKNIYIEDIDQESIAAHPRKNYFELRQAVNELPFQYKTVIILRYFEDMKISDIAGILGENVNTVKTRLYTALKKLRVEISEEDV
jgi:RNA polymerase sigma-70 factor (ECF subfamily)